MIWFWDMMWCKISPISATGFQISWGLTTDAILHGRRANPTNRVCGSLQCLVIVLPLDIKATHRPTIQKVKEMDDTPWNNHWLRGWHGPEMDDHEILYKELVFIPLS